MDVGIYSYSCIQALESREKKFNIDIITWGEKEMLVVSWVKGSRGDRIHGEMRVQEITVQEDTSQNLQIKQAKIEAKLRNSGIAQFINLI